MLQFFVFFLEFFCWNSLILRLVKVDKGLLQDICTFMTVLRVICFVTPNE